jgi:hypothetical protein
LPTKQNFLVDRDHDFIFNKSGDAGQTVRLEQWRDNCEAELPDPDNGNSRLTWMKS